MKITPKMKAEFERAAGYGIRLESVDVAPNGETRFSFFASVLGRSMTIGCQDADTPGKAEREAARVGAYASQFVDRRLSARAASNATVGE